MLFRKFKKNRVYYALFCFWHSHDDQTPFKKLRPRLKPLAVELRVDACV